mgnify:CR=1 FL=1
MIAIKWVTIVLNLDFFPEEFYVSIHLLHSRDNRNFHSLAGIDNVHNEHLFEQEKNNLRLTK